MQLRIGRHAPLMLLVAALLTLLGGCFGRPLQSQMAERPRGRMVLGPEGLGPGILRRPVLANEVKPYDHTMKEKHFDEIAKANALRASAHAPAPNHLGWGSHWLHTESKRWDPGPNGPLKCTTPGGISVDLGRLYEFLTSKKKTLRVK